MRGRGREGLTISARVARFFVHCRIGQTRIRRGQFTGTLLAFAGVSGGAMGGTCIETFRGLISAARPAPGGHLVGADVISGCEAFMVGSRVTYG